MGLLGEVQAVKASRVKGKPCRVRVISADLEPQEVKDLDDLMADTENYEGAVIAEALRNRGYEIDDEALRRHRRGACGCPR